MLIKKAIKEILKTTTEVTSPISITGDGWSAYSSDQTPYVRKRSGVVTSNGALKNTATKTINTTEQVGYNGRSTQEAHLTL